LRVPCPSTMAGTRDGILGSPGGFRLFNLWRKRRSTSGFVSFNPISRFSFAAWKSPENHNRSTDFSNIYDWLELINWKSRHYPVSQVLNHKSGTRFSFCSWIEPPPKLQIQSRETQTTNSKEKKGEKDYGRTELINHVVSHFYTLIVLKTLNATPVPIKQPGICGWKCNSLTFSM
jgi:hypothetical protein